MPRTSAFLRLCILLLSAAASGLAAGSAGAQGPAEDRNMTLEERPISSCIEPGRCDPEPCICPDVYLPVCGVDGRTYGNACQASCAGVEIDHRGECRDKQCSDNQDCRGDQICYPPTAQCQFPCKVLCIVPDPVCGSDGVTYGCGAADAHCHGAEVDHAGPCRSCKCLDIDAPVCGKDGQTYRNPCEANCAGVEIAHRGPCGRCNCPDVLRPVCGIDGKTYRNRCRAKCADVEVKHKGRCDECPACICPDVWRPVCGADGETYSNACQAGCADVRIVHYGECLRPFPCPVYQLEDVEAGKVDLSRPYPWRCTPVPRPLPGPQPVPLEPLDPRP